MERIDPILLSVIADWFINFSVFWFGLAIAGPLFPGITPSARLVVLTGDILLGIVTLALAFWLRKKI